MTFATNEVLVPRTDAGAAAQVVATVVITMTIAILVRRERALVVLALGLGAVVLGAMGLRTLH